MNLRKKHTDAKEKYPDVDIFIRGDVLFIDGIPEEECTRRSLSLRYFLPRDDFTITYALGDPFESIPKKGMADVEFSVEEDRRNRG